MSVTLPLGRSTAANTLGTTLGAPFALSATAPAVENDPSGSVVVTVENPLPLVMVPSARVAADRRT